MRYAYDISISHVAKPEQLDATKRNTYLQMRQAVGVQLAGSRGILASPHIIMPWGMV